MTALGIDLGTTNSCVAVYRNGRVRVILDAEGKPITPSMVAVTAQGETLVGAAAKVQAEKNPGHTYRGVKRLIGRRFADAEVAAMRQRAAFGIGEAGNGMAWIVDRDGALMPPQQVSAMVLMRLVANARRALGSTTIKKAVITVPAYFSDAQRRATREAGELAGLEVLRIINEPTAAALASLEYADDRARNVAVFDLGGGTFDISILRAQGEAFEVLATNGDTFLGGEDFDNAIVDYLAEAFIKQHGIDPRADRLVVQRLYDAAEQAKIALSSVSVHEIDVPYLWLSEKPLHLKVTLTRDTLELLTAPLVQRCTDICKLALDDAGLARAEIDQVLLVGGMTRMPAVEAAARAFFGERADLIAPDVDQIVAKGAAIMAAVCENEAAVHLRDVTPFAIGIETAEHGLFEIVERNTPIPARITRCFSTTRDAQEAVTVRLRQADNDEGRDGADVDARDVTPLAQYHLTGLRPSDAGVARIDVTVDIDADGVVMSSARDRATGKTNGVTVESLAGLSPRALDRLRREMRRVNIDDQQGLNPDG